MPKPTERSVLERAEEAAREKLKKPSANQADIAKLAGISQPSVSEWRTGGPRIETALTFAEATGVCVEWLYTGRGPKRPRPEIDPALAKIHDQWETLSQRTQGRILQLVEDEAGAAGEFRRRGS